MLTIRPAISDDLQSIKAIFDSVELFPSELLDEMMQDYFSNPQTSDIWLTARLDEQVVGVCYCAPEKLTDGTFNLYLIAVHKNHHSKGIGKILVNQLEAELKQKSVRLLIVETSSLPEFEPTKSFYRKCDFTEVATIPDFYQAGDHKIVFTKKL